MTNRPAPRLPARRMILPIIALAVLLVAAGTPASAEVLEDSGVKNSYHTVTDYDCQAENPCYIKVYKIQHYQKIESVYVKVRLHDRAKPVLAAKPYYESPVTLKIGSTVIGHGTAYYNAMFNSVGQVTGCQLWVDIDDIDIKSFSGTQSITLTPETGTLFNGVFIHFGTATQISDTHDIGFYMSASKYSGFLTGTHIVRSTYTWHNEISYDENNVYLTRKIDDNYYTSTITVTSDLGTVSDTSALDFQVPYLGECNWTVTNPHGKVFSGSVGASPDDPGDPSRVMVHIIAQDARNENLLLDAAVEVRDQYDAVVAAGTTSPEGWMVFEYDLPDTLTDEDFDRYYTVSVSLPGWTQKVTNFKFYPAFIPRSGDWIRVEMLPDTDGPADPEKTYIMFFVRDIHANPLERASIEIAGQYWHTNSAGHVAVEVPKNSTTAYTVRKTGHVSISGSAAVGAEGSYVVNIALGPALPDRTPGPGDDPGATPPPRDTRTNEEKGKAVIDLIADNAELIATLAILAAVMGLINLIMPGRRRR